VSRRRYLRFALVLTIVTLFVRTAPASAQPSADQPNQAPPAATDADRTGWRGALVDSMRLLMLEHAGRIAFQEKTRRELGGPFFADYVHSLRIPRTWNDGDQWPVNYVGHPIHGAASGFIWIDHRRDESALAFSTKAYWKSRGIAAAWIAGYSLQFEFGLLSEASIGNVGMNPATTGWVDHVVTPAGGLAFIVAEDALDRYLIVRIEHWTSNSLVRGIARVALNPSRSLSNITQGSSPWFRAARPLR